MYLAPLVPTRHLPIRSICLPLGMRISIYDVTVFASLPSKAVIPSQKTTSTSPSMPVRASAYPMESNSIPISSEYSGSAISILRGDIPKADVIHFRIG